MPPSPLMGLASNVIKAGEDTPQLAAGRNRRVGWQAASLGVAKRIRAAKISRIRAVDAPQLAGGYVTLRERSDRRIPGWGGPGEVNVPTRT